MNSLELCDGGGRADVGLLLWNTGSQVHVPMLFLELQTFRGMGPQWGPQPAPWPCPSLALPSSAYPASVSPKSKPENGRRIKPPLKAASSFLGSSATHSIICVKRPLKLPALGSSSSLKATQRTYHCLGSCQPSWV